MSASRGERWVMLYLPTDTVHERYLYGGQPQVVAEAPRSPFESVTLASEQETGIFGRLALPRVTQS